MIPTLFFNGQEVFIQQNVLQLHIRQRGKIHSLKFQIGHCDSRAGGKHYDNISDSFRYLYGISFSLYSNVAARLAACIYSQQYGSSAMPQTSLQNLGSQRTRKGERRREGGDIGISYTTRTVQCRDLDSQSLSLSLSLHATSANNGRSFFVLLKNEFLNNYFEWDRVQEKRNSTHKNCQVDPAGHFGTPYVLSTGRTAPKTAPEDPYEAGETINIDRQSEH